MSRRNVVPMLIGERYSWLYSQEGMLGQNVILVRFDIEWG